MKKTPVQMAINILAQLLLEMEVAGKNDTIMTFVRKSQVASMLSCITEIGNLDIDVVKETLHKEYEKLTDEYMKSVRVGEGDSIISSILRDEKI